MAEGAPSPLSLTRELSDDTVQQVQLQQLQQLPELIEELLRKQIAPLRAEIRDLDRAVHFEVGALRSEMREIADAEHDD